MKILDNAGSQILLVVGDQNKLNGIITDGDIRRGILQGYSIKEKVEKIMNKNFFL